MLRDECVWGSQIPDGWAGIFMCYRHALTTARWALYGDRSFRKVNRRYAREWSLAGVLR